MHSMRTRFSPALPAGPWGYRDSQGGVFERQCARDAMGRATAPGRAGGRAGLSIRHLDGRRPPGRAPAGGWPFKARTRGGVARSRDVPVRARGGAGTARVERGPGSTGIRSRVPGGRAETERFLSCSAPIAGILFCGVPGAMEPPGWSVVCVRPSVHAGTTPVSAGSPPQTKPTAPAKFESAVKYPDQTLTGKRALHRGLAVARAAVYPRSVTDGV